MIRIFNIYYPTRVLLLLCVEGVVICTSFLLATLIRFGGDSLLVLDAENGLKKILIVTLLAILCLYYFDLYDLQRLRSQGEIYFRILFVLGTLSLLLAGVGMLMPDFTLGRGVLLLGLLILTMGLLSWRSAYFWLLKQSYFRERVYVLGSGDRAAKLVSALRTRPELGMDVIGWAGAIGNGSLTREGLGEILTGLKEKRGVDRIIVAMSDRREKLPVRELLEMRLRNIKVAEATLLSEQISGQIDVDDLLPSWLIFSEGFHLSPMFMLLRRIVSTMLAFIGLMLAAPLLPLIALAIKLSGPGPVFYSQTRVGRDGAVFYCYKFRTMRRDAEADKGPTWATDDDPRITKVGRVLRKLRLDELPQLWNVLRGDMSFVGPRPERPEFVQSLVREIPYYYLRLIVRPGITGWAQISYPYGASVAESKEKLQYDLYYIKNMSVGFDLFIVFQTIKIVLFSRGSR